jgi:uncharacterized protein (TIGR02001 family)
MKKETVRMAAAASALLLGSVATVNQALAQDPWSFSANIGAVSNYVWRGVTQTGDQAAVQGGIDVAHDSGFYAGTWISNIDWGTPDPNYELDLYTGFGGAITDDLSYDLGAIYYAYPDGRDSDFAELTLSGTYKWFTLGAAYTVYGENDGGLFDDGDWYFFGGAEVDLPYDFGFSVRGGYYSFRHDEGTYDVVVNNVIYTRTESYDYWNYGASITRDAGDFGTFSLNWDQNSGDQDLGYDPDPKFWVGWSKEF